MKEKIYNFTADTGIYLMSKLFPEYFAKEPLRPTDRYYEYPWALRHIFLYTKSAKILDVGSAGSMFPLLIKALRHEVYSIDIRKVDYETVYCGTQNICKTTFGDNAFDIITAISTIEHIGLEGRYGVSKEDTDYMAIDEIARIIRPNGQFLMTVPFGNKYKETKFHKIYDMPYLERLLARFKTSIDIVKSPESDEKIALIKAVK